MRVVFANKFHYLKGGAERYAFDLAFQLNRFGHEIIPFSMQDSRNSKTAWSRNFVSPVQTERVSFGWQGLRTAGRMLYSFEARRRFRRLLDEAKPDLLHVHNIYHQLSPSFLPVAKERGLPIVMTAHDYALVAPNYSLYHDGAICEITKPDRFWKAVGHRCVKRSRAASALEALEFSLHRALGLYLNNLDVIIAPSRFLQATLADYGVPADLIVHIPHPVATEGRTVTAGGRYALFVGRLSPEKGVDTLIRAAAKAKEVPLQIVGTGPEEARLKALCRRLSADNVKFLGFKQGAELENAYAGAAFTVVPSVWYEVAGLVALESYAHGKPVIASQIGGLAEAVVDGETGLYVSAGDVDDLAEQMSRLWSDPAAAQEMGRAGRATVEKENNPETHAGKILWAYELAKGRAKLAASRE